MSINKTYVVSGLERCGTSMAMQCLQAGMPHIPVFDNAHLYGSSPLNRVEGYDPNPKGYWEVPAWSEWGPDWYTHVQGKLVKVMARHITRLGPAAPGYHYYVVWMTRDHEEMNASRIRSGKMPMDLDTCTKMIQRNAGILWVRRDVTIVTIDHSDFIRRPGWVYEILRATGFSDLHKKEEFISRVDASLYRNRRTND